MRKFHHTLIHSLLLLTTPSLLVYPQEPQFILEQIYSQEKAFEDFDLSYDDILRLLQEIEEERVEGMSDEKEDRIVQFITFLAENGKLPGDSVANFELDNDILTLLEGRGDFSDYAYASDSLDEYTIAQALVNGEENAFALLCKHKKHKKDKKHKKHKDQQQPQQEHHHHHHHKKNFFDRLKHFIKKHKKAIIIGAAIVVAATVVIVAVTAATSAGAMAAAGAAAGAASAPDPNRTTDAKAPQEPTLSSGDTPPDMTSLKSTLDDQIFSFKENIQQNQFFQSTNPSGQQGLSWEENGRALGSLFAHDSYHHFQPERFTQDYSNYGFQNPNTLSGHVDIDRTFSTDYGYLYTSSGQNPDFNTYSHQVRGEAALNWGYYNQAIEDFGKAIEFNPTNPFPYLERGIAHFGLGEYDRSIEDYKQFASQAEKPNSTSVSEFSIGFAKGLPKGIYESGEGLLLFMADAVSHPKQTAVQMFDSFTTLVKMVRDEEGGAIAEALFPEIRKLVIEWDNLSSDTRGELAGYALGKHGADIVIPGGMAKIASNSIKNAQKLISVCKKMGMAESTLILETAAEIGNGAKIAEVVEVGRKTSFLAEELGISAPEIGQLKQAGKLETAIAQKCEHLSLPKQESIRLFEEAGNKLKPHQGVYMPEPQARELIHATGIPTFPRPAGIPGNYRVKLSDKPGGIKYVHPTDEGTYIRIMPGKAHSPFSLQREPYVNQRVHGKSIDKHGNIVPNDSPEAHIPLQEFIYRGIND